MTTRSLLDKLRLSDLNPGASSGGVTRGEPEWLAGSGDRLVSHNPATGEPIAAVTMAGPDECDRVIGAATRAFGTWRERPAPKRGDLVRDLGSALAI